MYTNLHYTAVLLYILVVLGPAYHILTVCLCHQINKDSLILKPWISVIFLIFQSCGFLGHLPKKKRGFV